MLYDSGDACNSDITRKALVHWICLSSTSSSKPERSQLQKIEEIDLCLYNIHFVSPFACNLQFKRADFPTEAEINELLVSRRTPAESTEGQEKVFDTEEYIRRLEIEIVRLNKEVDLLRLDTSIVLQRVAKFWSTAVVKLAEIMWIL